MPGVEVEVIFRTDKIQIVYHRVDIHKKHRIETMRAAFYGEDYCNQAIAQLSEYLESDKSELDAFGIAANSAYIGDTESFWVECRISQHPGHALEAEWVEIPPTHDPRLKGTVSSISYPMATACELDPDKRGGYTVTIDARADQRYKQLATLCEAICIGSSRPSIEGYNFRSRIEVEQFIIDHARDALDYAFSRRMMYQFILEHHLVDPEKELEYTVIIEFLNSIIDPF